jgi:hypothetical protein
MQYLVFALLFAVGFYLGVQFLIKLAIGLACIVILIGLAGLGYAAVAVIAWTIRMTWWLACAVRRGFHWLFVPGARRPAVQ